MSSSCIYCVYLTTYSGNKLPPFYIGSTSLDSVSNGYRGSVESIQYKEIWKKELRENPEKFKTFVISKHNTRKDAFDKEEKLHRILNVVRSDMYINKTFANQRYSFYGKCHTEESKAKTSAALKGKPKPEWHGANVSKAHIGKRKKYDVWNKGKTGVQTCSDESRQKMSNAGKGRPKSDEHKEKIRAALKGKPKSKEHTDKNSMSRGTPVIISGVTYRNIATAMRILGLSRGMVKRLAGI